jgi:fatty acid desaturase
MDQEFLKPDKAPKSSSQAFSPLGCFIAAAGVTLLTFCLVGAAAASVWALSKLLGLPDTALYVLLGIVAIPVLWSTVWTAGRAWHVERRLAGHNDIDAPVFKLGYYFRKSA